MVFLALNWRVWVILLALFLFALARRTLRNWHHRWRGEPIPVTRWRRWRDAFRNGVGRGG